MARKIEQWLGKLKVWLQGERGLGLVESVVAVAILGVAVTAFVVALSAGSLAVSEQDQEVTAQSLARTQLEYIKPQDYIPTADYDPDDPEASYATVDSPEGYGISVEVGPTPDADNDIQKITVAISRDGENILEVEDYKVNR